MARRERRGKHEPLFMQIRRPRARIDLAREDAELIMSALADAASYRQWRASQWCARCDDAAEGTCKDHLRDGALTGAYRELAEWLAEVLPRPASEAGR
jgi:hypothetical protein